MLVKSSEDFINFVVKNRALPKEYIVVKPNWVSSDPGEFTEPEILDWLFKAFPNQKKIVIESYTPWRGLRFEETDTHQGEGVTLEGGKKHWDFYRQQDGHFLATNGIAAILKDHHADYVNITNEWWAGECVSPDVIKALVEVNHHVIKHQELFSYIPKKIFAIRDKATFISLSKIKIEESIPVIGISMSVKNLFGLIPNPSRFTPYHDNNHANVPSAIKDMYAIYTSLFADTLWITEGVKTMIRHYCEPNQQILINQNYLFVGKNGKAVDSEACQELGINPHTIPHLELIN